MNPKGTICNTYYIPSGFLNDLNRSMLHQRVIMEVTANGIV